MLRNFRRPAASREAKRMSAHSAGTVGKAIRIGQKKHIDRSFDFSVQPQGIERNGPENNELRLELNGVTNLFSGNTCGRRGHMELTRRNFLKAGAGASLAILAGMPGLDLSPAYAYSAKMGKLAATTEKSTICPYCGVGCGAIMASRVVNGKLKIVNLEGDPDHPINRGALCSKGNAIYQIHDDPGKKRLAYVEYRAPGSSKWEKKSWQWAIDQIAQRVRATREASFVPTNAAGLTVNRTEGIACLGGASLDNEECYLLSKWARSLGIVYLEHQARI